MKLILVTALVLLGVAAGAQAASSGGTQVAVRSSQYGKVLFTSAGKALYVFEADKGSKSSCYGACAKAWPPLLTKGTPIALPGVDHMLLGKTVRTDGTGQVTYKGHPLYTYSADALGKVGCQHVSNFGALWLAIEPNGVVNMAAHKA